MNVTPGKVVALLGVLALVALLSVDLTSGPDEPEAAAAPRIAEQRPDRTEARVLAHEQAGGPPSEELVRTFEDRLASIARKCRWSRRETSDKLLRMHQILEEEGRFVQLLDLTVGLDDAKTGVATDCHELLATLGAILGRAEPLDAELP